MVKRLKHTLPTLVYGIWIAAQFILLLAMLTRTIGTGLDSAFVRSLWDYYFYSTGLISFTLLLLPFLKKRQLLMPKKKLLYFGAFFTFLAHLFAFFYMAITFGDARVMDFPIPVLALIMIQLLAIVFILFGTINFGLEQQQIPISKIFISYSRKDSDIAHEIKNLLKSNGFEVEIDVDAFAFGDHIEDRILQAIKNTDLTIGLISENSLRSVWVGLELINTVLKEKIDNQKRFVGVLLDNSIFSSDFYSDLRKSLENENQSIDTSLQKAIKEKDGIERYTEARKRVRDYLHYQDDLFKRLQQFIQADATKTSERKKNLEKLAKQLKSQTRILDA